MAQLELSATEQQRLQQEATARPQGDDGWWVDGGLMVGGLWVHDGSWWLVKVW